MDLLNLEFEQLISTPTGVGASTGRDTAEAFNGNFDLIRDAISQLLVLIADQVVSDEVRQLRVDTSVTPAIVYYTTTPLTEEPVWVKLVDLSFTNISGDPLSNIALKELFDSKGSAIDVADLKTKMALLESTVSSLNDEVDVVSALANSNKSSISILQADFALAVKTTEGNVLYLRHNPGNNTLEFSTNGTDWVNASGTNITFDTLTGNPADNEALVQYIDEQVSGGTGGYVTTETFNGHAGNFGNPHVVTKEQIGLGAVENYSAANMPLSTEAAQKFEELATRFPAFEYVSKETYDTYEPENKVYMISSHF